MFLTLLLWVMFLFFVLFSAGVIIACTVLLVRAAKEGKISVHDIDVNVRDQPIAFIGLTAIMLWFLWFAIGMLVEIVMFLAP